ncbi:hypothetical protein LTR37_015188 [Vermiconidia calcicola]|uniref:Uncharacterized protein n=1 Tax=Vermiconidia calcicola TaxID=1690605 RepID=A0ACC3MS16_9PEZI|nr:hypothetical protein LTR37_015188 [Vermiconidia calcicola]
MMRTKMKDEYLLELAVIRTSRLKDPTPLVDERPTKRLEQSPSKATTSKMVETADERVLEGNIDSEREAEIENPLNKSDGELADILNNAVEQAGEDVDPEAVAMPPETLDTATPSTRPRRKRKTLVEELAIETREYGHGGDRLVYKTDDDKLYELLDGTKSKTRPEWTKGKERAFVESARPSVEGDLTSRAARQAARIKIQEAAKPKGTR